MKRRILLIALLYGFFGRGQNDTIQVSANTAVMVFPSNISDAFLGNELEFYMGDRKKDGSQFSKRILKLYFNDASTKSKAYTSLLVITTNGNSYEFVLESTEKPKQATWYISPEQAVTNILGKKISNSYQQVNKNETESDDDDNSVSEDNTEFSENSNVTNDENEEEVPIPTQELYELDKDEFFRRKCYYNYTERGNVKQFFARFDDVFLWLRGVYYNNNEIYLQFSIENKENVDYDLNYMKFSIESNYRNAFNKDNEHKTRYRYKVPKKVKGNSENYFMVVFDKFNLDKKKILKVDLDEEKGARNISLKIFRNIINNPKRF